MKHIILLITGLFFLFFASNLLAQEEEVDTRPVRNPWNCTMLVDHQTVVSPSKGALEFIIHHRMGAINNGTTDLFGIYAASNIRLALQYGITDKLMVGFGTEKDNKMQEFFWKYAILQQTRSGNIPVSLSYYGNAVIDARDEVVFGQDYGFTDRMSYFTQLIVSRKWNKDFSTQIAAGYAHVNAVDSVWQNNAMAFSIGAKYDLFGAMSAIAEYDYSVSTKSRKHYQNDIEPNLALGFEIATSTHAFQLFVSNYKNIIAQKNHLYNMRALDSEGIGVGFNITVRF